MVILYVVRFTYTGADDERIPDEATHIFVQARVIRRNAFRNHRKIVEIICHDDVEKIEAYAFFDCPSLRRVIMPGVKIVERSAFLDCEALEDVECDKLEIIIGFHAFGWYEYLRSINLPSARIVRSSAFFSCRDLTDVKFGSKLERIEVRAFHNCRSLERITIPLKDGLIPADNIFIECDNLHKVDLVEGELHETIAALHLKEWRNGMHGEIDSINQSLPNADPGSWARPDEQEPGEIAQEIRRWIRSVLEKITRYQAEHRRLLEEDVATILQCELPVAFSQDIVMKSALPFLELPPYTFEVEDE